jgi:hypothetical protein
MRGAGPMKIAEACKSEQSGYAPDKGRAREAREDQLGQHVARDPVRQHRRLGAAIIGAEFGHACAPAGPACGGRSRAGCGAQMPSPVKMPFPRHLIVPRHVIQGRGFNLTGRWNVSGLVDSLSRPHGARTGASTNCTARFGYPARAWLRFTGCRASRPYRSAA